MGCTKSKIVAPVPTEGENQSRHQASNSVTAKGIGDDQPSTSKDTKKKKNRVKSSKAPLPPINPSALLPDIELFSSYQYESSELAVNNAKPRLNCPGIGRAIRLAPIVPGVEQQKSNINASDLKESLQNGSSHTFNRNEFHIPTEPSSGRASLTNSDLGFFQNRQPPISVSPRNSISRTTMKTGLTPDSSGIFSNFGSEFSPLNTSRSSFLPASRASSARTGSVLTTNALNTSFMTSIDGDDDFNPENTLEACHLDITDAGSEADTSSRAASATPMLRLSGDPPVNLPPDVGGIGTIVEEYEGGFTPRGPSKDTSLADFKPTPDNKLPHFTPKEIYEHNDRRGQVDWCMYLGKVYDVTRIKNTFEPIIKDIHQSYKDKQKNKITESSSDSDSDSNTETKNKIQDSSSDSDSDHLPVHTPVKWNHRSVYNMLRAGLDKATLNQFLHGCCVGFVVQQDETRFWEDIRSDVRKVLDDLIRADSKDILSAYSAEYMHLLQRWMTKYRHAIPSVSVTPKVKDMNQEVYPLPEEIAKTPEVLREWLDAWVTFDLTLPEHGTAWDLAESQDEDDGINDDPHQIFLSSLRPYLQELPDLDHTINGETAWATIPQNIFADDIMTNEQLRTEASRQNRKDLFNPESMKRRRSKLFHYFLKKYELDKESVAHFLEWANVMKKGEEQFLLLCR
ncbi:hypothetical protein RRG08_046644 [Elysia crispata]|uniref:Uncharacterized protein n=1 Tax=Elysia crispata TaxID=231223 RepID=A0AAE1AQU7_9GAST|nr:hypothetical protein RRG08_046644 [Elysia crispata]